MTTASKLKTLKVQIDKLSDKIRRLESQREKLSKQDRLERARRAGIVVGSYYRAIPVEQGGNVFAGKVKKIDTNHWRSNVMVSMLIPVSGRYTERVVFIDLDKYEFEKIKAPKKL